MAEQDLGARVMPDTLNLLHDYYTTVSPNPKVLKFCGVSERDVPYTVQRDDDLTVIINGYARPEYLPLVWEGIQYQTRRPYETWIIQNSPQGRCPVPRKFFEEARRFHTKIIDSDLNHGCWFRFLVAALYCRTRYVAIYDDDALSGRLALEAAVSDLSRTPGIYGCWGATFLNEPDGPSYWKRELAGWPAAQDHPVAVDFVGQMWVLETDWLKALFNYLPERLFATPDPGRECGEELLVSFVGQKLGRQTFIYSIGREYNPRWASIQGIEMGGHPAAMSQTGGLSQADYHLRLLRTLGWSLRRYG
jgi:hypothetical protein